MLGEGVSEKQLALIQKRFHYHTISKALNLLDESNWITRNDKYNWILVRPLTSLSLSDLLRLTPCFPNSKEVEQVVETEHDLKLASALKKIGNYESDLMETPLSILTPHQGNENFEIDP